MQHLLTDPTKYVSLADNPAQAMYDQLIESIFLHESAECVVKCDVPYWAAKVINGCSTVKFYLSIVNGKFAMVSLIPFALIRFHFDKYEVMHGELYAFRTPHIEAVIEFINKYSRKVNLE